MLGNDATLQRLPMFGPITKEPTGSAQLLLTTLGRQCGNDIGRSEPSEGVHDMSDLVVETSAMGHVQGYGASIQYLSNRNPSYAIPLESSYTPLSWDNQQVSVLHDVPAAWSGGPAAATPTPPRYHVRTKKVFVCAWPHCGKEYSRRPDVERHHRGAHQFLDHHKCRKLGCERAIRGFSRKDKRGSHEQVMHGIGRFPNAVNGFPFSADAQMLGCAIDFDSTLGLE